MYHGKVRAPRASASAKVARARAAWLRRGHTRIGAVPPPANARDRASLTRTLTLRKGQQQQPRQQQQQHTQDGATPHPLSSSAASTCGALSTRASRRAPVPVEEACAQSNHPVPLIYHAWVRRSSVSALSAAEQSEALKWRLSTLSDGEAHDREEAEEVATERTRGGVLHGTRISSHGSSLPLFISQWGGSARQTLAAIRRRRCPSTSISLSDHFSSRLLAALFSPSTQQPLSPVLHGVPHMCVRLAHALREANVSRDIDSDHLTQADVERMRAFSATLGQRVPSLVVLAETARDAATPSPPSSTLHWRCPDGREMSLPTTSLPVNVLVDRINVCDVLCDPSLGGDSVCEAVPSRRQTTLERALVKAQRELMHTGWYTSHVQTDTPPHYIWNGDGWLLEEDTRLTGRLEALVQPHRHQQDKKKWDVPTNVRVRAWLPPHCSHRALHGHTSAVLWPHAFVHATRRWSLPKWWCLTGLNTFLAAECGVRVDKLKRKRLTPGEEEAANEKGPCDGVADRGAVRDSPTTLTTGTTYSSWWTSLLASGILRDGLHFPAFDAISGFVFHPGRSLPRTVVPRAKLFKAEVEAVPTSVAPITRTDLSPASASDEHETNPFAIGVAAQHIAWWPIHWLRSAVVPLGWQIPDPVPLPLLTDKGLREHVEHKRSRTSARRRPRRRDKTRATPEGTDRREQANACENENVRQEAIDPSRTGTGETNTVLSTDALWEASAALTGEKTVVGVFAHDLPPWVVEALTLTRPTTAENGEEEANAPNAGNCAAATRHEETRASSMRLLHAAMAHADPCKAVWATLVSSTSSSRAKKKKAKDEKVEEPLLWVLSYAPWGTNKTPTLSACPPPTSPSAPEVNHDDSHNASSESLLQWHVYTISASARLNFIFPLHDALARMAPAGEFTSLWARQGGASSRSDQRCLEKAVMRGHVFIDICALLWLLFATPAFSCRANELLHKHALGALVGMPSPSFSPCHRGEDRVWSNTRYVNALVDCMRHVQSWPAVTYNLVMAKATTEVEEGTTKQPTGVTRKTEEAAEVASCASPSTEEISLPTEHEDGHAVQESDWGTFILRDDDDGGENDDLPAIDRRPDTASRRLLQDDGHVRVKQSTRKGRASEMCSTAPTTALAASLIAAHPSTVAYQRCGENPSGEARADKDGETLSHAQSVGFHNPLLKDRDDHLSRCVRSEQQRLRRRWAPWQRYVVHPLSVKTCLVEDVLDTDPLTARPTRVSTACLGVSIVSVRSETRYVNAANIVVQHEEDAPPSA